MASDTAPAPAPAPAADSGRLLRLVVLGALLGIPAALASVALLGAVHELEHWLWHDLPHHLGYDDAPWFLVIGLPVVGAVVVLLARMLPGDGGHAPSDGLVLGPTPHQHVPGIVLAAIGSLAFGAVLGPEGPLVALGAAVGAGVAALFKCNAKETSVLAAAGSFSAISALFGGPLPAGALLTEASAGLALGAAQTAMLLPGFVAAAFGYMIFVGFGSFAGVDTFPISVPGLPAYGQIKIGDLVVALVVGVVATVVLTSIRSAANRFVHGKRGGMPTAVLLLGGALLVGLIAQAATLFGASSQDVFFSGQAGLPTIAVETSAGTLFALLVAKALAYLICLSCGFRGGAIFPAIFVAVAIAQFAVIFFDVSPTLAVAVGTAVGMVAFTRLVLAGILMAALLAGTAGLDAVPAAVIAGSAAWLTSAWLSARLDKAPAPESASE